MGLCHMGGLLSEVTPLVLTDSPPAHPPEQGGSVLGPAACCVSHAADVSTRTLRCSSLQCCPRLRVTELPRSPCSLPARCARGQSPSLSTARALS